MYKYPDYTSANDGLGASLPAGFSGDPAWKYKETYRDSYECRFQSTNSSPSGMIEGNTKEEDYSNMSFVGIIVLSDRVIGFADSKSSKISVLGGYEDPERGMVQKLFKNDQSIIVTYGCNEYYNELGIKKPLDDWINKHINNSISPEDLVLELHKTLLLNINNSNLKYAFLIGSFDEYGYYKRYMNAEYDGYYTGIKCYAQGLYTGGEEHYTLFANEMWEKLQSDRLSDAENSIKDIVNNKIQFFDQSGGYNPVGGPIITETLYRK